MFPHTKLPAGTQINPLHPLSRGLVGCWLFNEGAGSLANDLSGHQNHGELKNGVAWAPSKHGGSLKFDGVDDYVDCGSGETLNLGGSQNATWMGWINKTTDDTFVLSKGSPRDNALRYQIRYAGGILYLRTYDSSGWHDATWTVSISNNEWHFIAIGWDGSNISMFLDGQWNSDIVFLSSYFPITTEALFIGAGQGTNSNYLLSHFNGSIDSVRIYNRALSALEVKTLYLDPFCNMMKRPINRYYVAVAGGLSMAVAMHHYNQMKEN